MPRFCLADPKLGQNVMVVRDQKRMMMAYVVKHAKRRRRKKISYQDMYEGGSMQ